MKTTLKAMITLAVVAASTALAVEPADRELIPEARRVLDYLASVHGQKTLSGMASYGGWRPVYEVCGRVPAIYSNDACGWNKPIWGDSYRGVLQRAIDSTRRWWEDKGGIPAMQWHWAKPGDPEGGAWGGRNKSGPFDMAKAVTPGTAEHQAVMEDLERTADYLDQLAKARVPVLWRPLHEIDGGWFWWTDPQTPENTAALWRMMFDYFTKERKLHNLIWVYNAALRCGKGKEGVTNVAMRKRFYPGANYVDIASIDVYPNESSGIGKPQDDTYATSFDTMKQVAPGKMIALAECEAIPNPDKLAKDGPAWLYCLPWWGVGKKHTAEWAKTTYAHEHFVTLGQLPKWNRTK